MKKRITALLLCLVMALSLIPTTVWAANADAEGTDDGISVQANGTGHRISVKIYKVVLDSSKPLGYQNPELINTITVTCQDRTSHSGYNHSVNLKEFYPTNVGATTTDWSGWEFDSYYTKGNEKETFYNWTKGTVNATANVTGSEPYPCSKNFYLVYKDTTPQPDPITPPSTGPAYKEFGNLVDVICDSTVSHSDKTKSYPVEDAGIVGTPTSEPVKDANNTITGYKWVVTINKDYYVNQYKNDVSTDHTYKQDSREDLTIQFNWDGTNWSVDNTNNKGKVYVECEAVPQDPALDIVDGIPAGAVLVNCQTITDGTHNDSYALDANHVTFTAPAKDGNDYKCTMTVDLQKYFKEDYWTAHNGATLHPERTDSLGASYAIELTWDGTVRKWVAESGKLPVTMTTKCAPTVDFDKVDLADADEMVLVDCQPVDAHDYPYTKANTDATLRDSAISFGTIKEENGVWTCEMTIDLNKYLADYQSNHNDPSHKLVGTLSECKVALTWNVSEQKWVTTATKPFGTITVTCKPAKPTDAEMQGILGVKVDCVATTQVKPAHSASSRKFIDGTYEVGEPLYDTARNLWYCAVTITKPEAYIPGYDSDLSTITSIMAGKQVKYLHELKVEGAVAAPTAKLIYTAKGWEVDGKGSLDAQFATINVICRPALPTIPELNRLGVDVNVSCATKDSKHTGKTYDDLKDTDVVTGTITMNSQGQYECVLKLRDDTAKAYVTDYSGTTNADKKTHTLKDNGSITLVWGDNGWELKDQNAKTLIITATCTTGGGTNPGTKPGTNPGAKNPYVKDEGKKVESGKTFDAGIALYVGLGILSLTGSAAAIYKRREEY